MLLLAPFGRSAAITNTYVGWGGLMPEQSHDYGCLS